MENAPVKKASLYDLLSQTAEIQKAIKENCGELDSGLEDALSTLETAVPAKVQGYSNLIGQSYSMAEQFKAQEEQLRNARQSCEAFAEALEKRLKDLMIEKGIDRLDGKHIYYRLSKPTFKLALDPAAKAEDFDKDYQKTVVTVSLEKDKIKKDLESGKQIPGATLTTSQSLRQYPIGGGK